MITLPVSALSASVASLPLIASYPFSAQSFFASSHVINIVVSPFIPALGGLCGLCSPLGGREAVPVVAVMGGLGKSLPSALTTFVRMLMMPRATLNSVTVARYIVLASRQLQPMRQTRCIRSWW